VYSVDLAPLICFKYNVNGWGMFVLKYLSEGVVLNCKFKAEFEFMLGERV